MLRPGAPAAAAPDAACCAITLLDEANIVEPENRKEEGVKDEIAGQPESVEADSSPKPPCIDRVQISSTHTRAHTGNEHPQSPRNTGKKSGPTRSARRERWPCASPLTLRSLINELTYQTRQSRDWAQLSTPDHAKHAPVNRRMQVPRLASSTGHPHTVTLVTERRRLLPAHRWPQSCSFTPAKTPQTKAQRRRSVAADVRRKGSHPPLPPPAEQTAGRTADKNVADERRHELQRPPSKVAKARIDDA